MNRLHRWYCKSDHWKRTMTNGILPWALERVSLGEFALEIGPGPGVTTDWLRHRIARMECLELDPVLANALQCRLSATNVSVRCGDATAMPYENGCFSSVVSLTMLHHISTPELQDQLFREAHRVLEPGGTFAGVDSLPSILMSVFHLRDTLTLVDPNILAKRLAAAGFTDARVDADSRSFRFSARRPADPANRALEQSCAAAESPTFLMAHNSRF